MFTKTELNCAVRKTGMTSLRIHLSESSKDVLLEQFDKVWEKGTLPGSWEEVVMAPIHNPGKDCTNPRNYV